MARTFPPIETTPFPELFSASLFTATVCEELPFPWSPTATPAERTAQAAALVGLIPSSSFAPFDAATALSQQLMTLCRTWPGAGERFTPETGPLPNFPSLVIAGQQDTRTPLEGALAVAALFPRAQVLTVPDVGHSVVGTDTSECTDGQVVRFLELRSTGRCRGPGRIPISPMPPRRLSALLPVPGTSGARGRAARAVVLTVLDTVAYARLSPFSSGGGLRGGGFRFDGGIIRLDRVVYIPGVRVSGKASVLDGTANLRFAGIAGSGSVRIAHGLITGTVSGHGIRGKARLPIVSGGRGAGTPLGEGPTGPWPVS